MKREKLKITDLKVTSFVTKMDDSQKETIGGEAAANSWLISGCVLTFNCPTYLVKSEACCFSNKKLHWCKGQDTISAAAGGCPETVCCTTQGD